MGRGSSAMTLVDMLDIAAGNLRRMKLRTFLTTAGVVIAIAAFVAMLSFGAGNQQFVQDQFDRLGLFSMVIVYPREATDTTQARVLDDSVLTSFTDVPGVAMVYPYDAFDVRASLADTTVSVEAQALTHSALQTPVFSRLTAGRSFASDSAREALVTSDFLEELEMDSVASILGDTLVLTVQQPVVDSAVMHMLDIEEGRLERRLRSVNVDRLFNTEYRDSVLSAELGGAVQRFFDGFMNATVPVAETLTVVGVMDSHESRHRVRIRPIILPAATARKLSVGVSSDPTAVLSGLASGKLSFSSTIGDLRTYSQATVVMEPTANYETLRDTLQARGFGTFSFAEEFKEIRRAIFYFNLGLGMIGLIALITASLGIANTMIMSIIERTREIGMLKSLGAAASDIRLIFLVESGVIGSVGAALGIVFGWLVTRGVSAVAQAVMEREGIDPIDLFTLPWWLIGIAFVFGTVVSVLAGLYPAARAARIDPVQALRGE
ncbi:FtsX-like permease family protein [candidate division GN15 bacterium]|nr:FtsX-like permease family protein [candidate division GN15 bacterium]